MTSAYINRVATALPPHEVHRKFLDYAPAMLDDPRERRVLARMIERLDIDTRYSVLEPDPDPKALDVEGLFRKGGFPRTGERMRLFERHAGDLAMRAVQGLELARREEPTHLIVTTCTGLHAPGIDLEIARRLGLAGSVERTVVGFMGCYAALNALKLARHIVRSEPKARVLMVNVELCTLHLQETQDLEELLSFMIFADGCAASLISADPVGVEMLRFDTAILPDSADEITWRVADHGFDMRLSGAVPALIGRGLPEAMEKLCGEYTPRDLDLWAVHPGGRTVLDAVERAFRLDPQVLAASREVLRRYGNMSSPAVMFVIAALMNEAAGKTGVAMAFGPGLTAESMLFRMVGGRA